MFALRARSSIAAVARRKTLLPGRRGGLPTTPATAPPLQQRRTMAELPTPQSMLARPFEGHPTESEGWETTVAFWYTLSFFMLIAIANFTPETGIDAWAEQEARARMKLRAQGFTDFEFGKHYATMSDEDMNKEWDTFSGKAIRMNDDDDDDDEEEDDDDDDE